MIDTSLPYLHDLRAKVADATDCYNLKFFEISCKGDCVFASFQNRSAGFPGEKILLFVVVHPVTTDTR